ncbi:hypothetical protein [Pontibacter pamirensis]|uniref:hypothetical protein n=1 Tax=Pontibacter pamirensis TaxID=2562824 RepID=UPI001389AC3B|nr:hypothetical protein [Pontibacter pamirensis]
MKQKELKTNAKRKGNGILGLLPFLLVKYMMKADKQIADYKPTSHYFQFINPKQL